MSVIVESERWCATVLTGDPTPDGITHIYATTVGQTKADALAGAEWVLDMFAKGRFALIRVKPEAATDFDFDRKVDVHKGVTRFSFKPEPGAWQYPSTDAIVGFGG